MANAKRKAVHYINQFYGQIGGEEKADVQFSVKEEPFGPGKQLQVYLGDDIEIVATVICGDNYFSTHLEEASEELIKIVGKYSPDIFFSGPAFGAGRYGISCGHAAKVVSEKFNIPAVSGMFEENPGADAYRNVVYIAKTHNSAAKMREDLQRMANIGLHLVNNSHGAHFVDGVGIGTPEEEGYIPRGRIRNVYTKDIAAKRSVDMILHKIKGEPFETEMTFVTFEKADPAKPVKNIRKSRIAIVSDGALVDKDNIHHLKSRGSNVWGTYELHDFFAPEKTAEDYRVSHTGYFHMDVLEDRNRMVPYDVMTEMEKDGKIGELFDTYYALCGNCNADKWNVRMGQEIAESLKEHEVDAVIVTSTWGTSSRCGATLSFEIEKMGIPAVQITAVPTAAKVVGNSRILVGTSVTNPYGDSSFEPEREKKLRRKYIERALEILQKDVEKPTLFTLDGEERI